MSEGASFELKNFHKLQATIEKKLGGLVKGPVPRALRSVGEVWMTEAKRRTPVKFGVLRSSGHVEGPKVQGKEIVVRLVFGGLAASYAVIVHENLRAHHDVGQAKYLESVVVERRRNMTREIVAMIAGGRVHGAMFGGK